MYSRGVSRDVSPSPTIAQLRLLVSTLREESQAAHNLLKKYRLLLVSTRLVMEKRIPKRVTRAKVINTHDKATIEVIVAELDKLERLYSPHKVPDDGEDRVQGSLRDKAVIPGLGEERGRTSGSLPAKADVTRPEEERGRDDGPLRVDDGDGRVQGSLRGDEGDVLRLRRERGHTNGSPYPAIDWDNIARLSLSREKGITLSLAATTPLPVHACSPAPILHPDRDLVTNVITLRTEEIRKEMEVMRLLPLKTYNPMGGNYTPPTTHYPFGSIDGYLTNLGPISLPKGPVKGYILDPIYDYRGLLQHRWVLHATPPGQRRRGARGSRR